MLHTFEEKIAAEPILPAWVRDFPSTPFNPSLFSFSWLLFKQSGPLKVPSAIFKIHPSNTWQRRRTWV